MLVLPALVVALLLGLVAASCGGSSKALPSGPATTCALATPASAVLSAVIFNALIIIFLIPLALRGVPYKPMTANRFLRNNLLVYGVGGIVAPFIGIKLIDMILAALRLV